MRQFIVFLCLFLFAGQVLATAAVPEASLEPDGVVFGNAYIPKGTLLRAELQETIDSTTCNVGDKFTFKLLHNVIIANTLVISKGTIGEGVVKSVQRAGAFGKGGKIKLEAVSIQTVHGMNVPLSLDLQHTGGGHQADLSWYESNTSSATPALTVGVMSGLASGTDVQLGAGTKLIITIPLNVDLKATAVELP